MDFLLKNFKHLTTTPENIEQLKKIILQMAVHGKLTAKWREENPDVEPAGVLLEKIKSKKEQMIKEAKIKRQKPLPPIAGEEKPYDLPGSWEWEKLNNLGIVNPRNKIDKNIEVSFIPMKNISSNFNIDPISERKKWFSIKNNFTHFADNDVAIAKITPCFENSKAALFRNLINGVGAGTTELHVFRSISNELTADYIYCVLKSSYFLEAGKPKMKGVVGQKRVPPEFLKNFLVPVPPVKEQKVIVAKVNNLFSQIDKLYELTQKRMELREKSATALFNKINTAKNDSDFQETWELLRNNFKTIVQSKESVKQLRQSILQLAVQGKLTAKWREENPDVEPASALLEKIKSEKEQLIKEGKIKRQKPLPPISDEEKPFDLPETWEWTRISNIFNFIDYRGKTPRKINMGIRLITAKNVRFGYLQKEPEEFISLKEYEKRMIRGFPKKGDILITTEAPLGNLAILDITENIATGQRLITLQCYMNEFDNSSLFYFMLSPTFQNFLNMFASGITAKGIKSSKLKEIILPIPPLAEQKIIVGRLKKLMKWCNELEKQIDKRNDHRKNTIQAMA